MFFSKTSYYLILTYRKVGFLKFLDKTHGFRLVLTVEDVKFQLTFLLK